MKLRNSRSSSFCSSQKGQYMALLTELSSQAPGGRDAASSWTTVHNQRPLVSRSGEQRNSLPALSSLNLPSLVPRSPSNLIIQNTLISRTLAPARQKTSVKAMEEPEDNACGKKNMFLSKLVPQHVVNYGTSELLADLFVEPTPSNVQLFHICKISHDSAEYRIRNLAD